MQREYVAVLDGMEARAAMNRVAQAAIEEMERRRAEKRAARKRSRKRRRDDE